MNGPVKLETHLKLRRQYQAERDNNRALLATIALLKKQIAELKGEADQ